MVDFWLNICAEDRLSEQRQTFESEMSRVQREHQNELDSLGESCGPLALEFFPADTGTMTSLVPEITIKGTTTTTPTPHSPNNITLEVLCSQDEEEAVDATEIALICLLALVVLAAGVSGKVTLRLGAV